MAETDGRDEDPTLVRNQRQLTTASGTSWVVVGGVAAVAATVVLVPFLGGPLPWVASTALVLVALLVVGIAIARVAIPAPRTRNRTLAVLVLTLGLIAAVAISAIAYAVFTEFAAA